MTDTISGEKADDRCYVPAWRKMVKTAGRPDFLFIADCKAASAETRATIDREGLLSVSVADDGRYSGYSEGIGQEDDGPRKVGIGFVTGTVTEAVTEDGMTHEWRERRMFTRRDAHAERQKKGMKVPLQATRWKLVM